MNQFDILTLTVGGMIEYSNAQLRQGETNLFSYDFTYAYDRRKIIQSTNAYRPNALIHQIIRAVSDGDTAKIGEMYTDRSCIRKRLIYLDFNEFFPNWEKSKECENALQTLFKEGFTIRYEDSTIRYLPFDKSGSMSRQYKITFIDASIFDQVDEALRLGIPFSDDKHWTILLTKYYAYRGLYLTDATRIRTDRDEGFILNHETVLVLPDKNVRLGHIQFMTAKIDNEGKLTEIPVTADNSIIKKVINKSRTAFDGEGLISPAYAKYINESLSKLNGKNISASSFQIRMPFTKGMLHKVDFQKFLSQEVIDSGKRYIKDAFGINRDLSKVQIVLTESMFKCKKWLDQYARHYDKAEGVIDRMDLYFRRFEKYHHALYVGNTDLVAGGELVPLNYQFLNTIALNAEELRTLIREHTKKVLAAEDKYIEEASKKCATCNVPDDEITDETLVPDLPSWQYAIKENHAFLYDKYISSIINREMLSGIKDICRGRILVEGAVKFLSDDLLAFLCYLADNITELTDEEKTRIDHLKHKSLRSDRFFTADYDTLKLTHKDRCAILRNPHLSRNEQCSLRPYVPDQDDLYSKYFSKLTGILMLPYSSAETLALGGADFDGDIVKLISNEIICRAVVRSSYKWNRGKNKMGRRENFYVRKYPIIMIPGVSNLKVKTSTVPKYISFNTVRDTFCNQIGKISNEAVKTGMYIYNPANNSSASNDELLAIHNHMGMFTIATGLDIDAAKTGIRPDVESLDKATGFDIPPGDWDKFSDFMKTLEGIDSDYLLQYGDLEEVHSYDNGKELMLKKKDYEKKKKGSSSKSSQSTKMYQPIDAILYDTDAAVSNLQRLPGETLNALRMFRSAGNEKREKHRSMTSTDKKFLFEFQAYNDGDNKGDYNKDWCETCNQEKSDQLAAIVLAYRKAKDDVRKYAFAKECMRNYNSTGFILTNLKDGYDIDRENFLGSDIQIRNIIAYVYSDFEDYFIRQAKETDQSAITLLHQAIKYAQRYIYSGDGSDTRTLGNNWVTTRRDDLESTLTAILTGKEWSADDNETTLDDLGLSDVTKQLLLSDHNGSFDLLSFFLTDIRSDISSYASFGDWKEYREYKKNIDKGEDEPYINYSKEFYKQLIDMYNKREQLKEPKSAWNHDIKAASKKKLKALFEGNIQEALKHYWKESRRIDKNHVFFWDIFDTSDILNLIHKNESESITGE